MVVFEAVVDTEEDDGDFSEMDNQYIVSTSRSLQDLYTDSGLVVFLVRRGRPLT